MFPSIKQIPSPNHSSREGHSIVAVVIHIMEGSLIGTDNWFKQITSKVSAHYGVGRRGEIHQYVPEERAAWHAGRIVRPVNPLITHFYKGINPNLITIGIEHEGFAQDPWPADMFNSSTMLCADICKRNHITPDAMHILPHRHIRADKTCPGYKLSMENYINTVNKIINPPVNLSFGERLSEVERRLAILEQKVDK